MMKYAIVLVMVLFFGTFVYADPAVDSDTIKGIQTALNAAGYECGEPDGIAGQKTADALSKYCSDKGISWDGTKRIMSVDKMKARLHALLHQRDMLAYERDSLELFDLRNEIEDEIRELTKELRNIT